jgi:hypothetical protein
MQIFGLNGGRSFVYSQNNMYDAGKEMCIGDVKIENLINFCGNLLLGHIT